MFFDEEEVAEAKTKAIQVCMKRPLVAIQNMKPEDLQLNKIDGEEVDDRPNWTFIKDTVFETDNSLISSLKVHNKVAFGNLKKKEYLKRLKLR